ncbi:hypothetical protein RB2457 [Rhodopirellula baltica SH 1]|uniref:Uncharacterized protein n=1 Tax=Rhodopirellula baltica (strain DSM 10527 / NCIMB 13988 / SH1) TaxID=243090 RepID=Q7UVT5_RHOBA|nr:hypothetical protein RB2457 [Rhodopirellula baltica SH 1]
MRSPRQQSHHRVAGFARIRTATPVADSGPESALRAFNRNPAGALQFATGLTMIQSARPAVQAAPNHNPQRKQGSWRSGEPTQSLDRLHVNAFAASTKPSYRSRIRQNSDRHSRSRFRP